MKIPAGLELKGDDLYRTQYHDYYRAIIELLHTGEKININTVCKRLGKNRSAIRKDRPTFYTLIEDIETANKFKQAMDPNALLKETKSKVSEFRNEMKGYKEKYRHILGGYFELRNNISELNDEIDRLKAKNRELENGNRKLETIIAQLRNTNIIPFDKK